MVKASPGESSNIPAHAEGEDKKLTIEKIPAETEDATCPCSDDYGCGHGTERCGLPLSEQEKAQMELSKIPPSKLQIPKCEKCWKKDNEHQMKHITPGAVRIPPHQH